MSTEKRKGHFPSFLPLIFLRHLPLQLIKTGEGKLKNLSSGGGAAAAGGAAGGATAAAVEEEEEEEEEAADMGGLFGEEDAGGDY